ncbi:MAG: hypothetical protein CL672_06105 [Balneola sp.]|nr:hypothetical protein [Balneola sp.]|tara:strand:+ start:4507 stop:5010 length:504 start_codon:yes stop_codon:yes gene_type:complete
MNSINRLLILYSFLFLWLLLSSCQQDSAQQQYEAEAYGPVEGYTQTDLQQNVLSHDKKDWQVSPYYEGLIRILPLFPNPINYGGTAYLEMTLNGAPVQSYVELGYLNYNNQWIPLQQETVSSEFELVTFVIDSRNFGSNAELARGLHRLLLYDGNQRLITYGDILIK